MRIAVDATILEYDGRGISKATVAFYQNLKKIYPDIELFLLQKKELVTDFFVEHIKIQSPNYISDDIALKSYFPQKIKELKIDFIHFPFNGINVEYFKSVRPEIKTISTIHDIIPAMIPDVYNLSDFEIIKYLKDVQVRVDHTDILLTISECSKNDLITHLKLKTNPIVIYNSHFSKTPNNIQVVEWQETTAKHDTEKAFYPIHQPGVYLYTTMDRRPLYVGRAENLEDRFDEHLSDNESNKDLKYYIHKLYYLRISHLLHLVISTLLCNYSRRKF